MGKLQRGPCIYSVKHILNSNAIRRMPFDHDSQLPCNFQQTNSQRVFRVRLYNMGLDHPMRRAVGFDRAITGALSSTVDPQDAHVGERAARYASASISFSSMSAFENTFCTSSCSSSASSSLINPVTFFPST